MAEAKLPWLVLDMDEGLLRRAATRREAVKWCTDQYGPVLNRHRYRPGAYGYVFGRSGEERNASLFIETEQASCAGGWKDLGEALYPYPDKPYERRIDDREPQE